MKTPLALILAAGLAAAAPVPCQAQAEPPTSPPPVLTAPQGFSGPREYAAALRKLAESHPETVEVAEIGTSRRGFPLLVARLATVGDAEQAPPEERPAVLIVAGIDGRHRVGSDVAVELAAQLCGGPAGLLRTTTVYIIPCLNPDTMSWHADQEHVRLDFGRVFAETDADRDRRVNEDPADDLNGDGAITLMRVRNPGPGTGLRAEHMIDPDNPKLLKSADRAKGERAEYAVLVEGEDNDGDGRFNEDGPGGSGGGIDLNRNFPYRWPELTDGAGPFQLCEPESHAIVRWMLDTPNIAAVLVYGPGDTLINIPEAGKMDETGEVPLGIEQGDKQVYEEIAKLYKEATRINEAPPMDLAGSFVGWCYGSYGVPAFQSQVWVRPDQIKAEAKADEKPENGNGEPQQETEPKPAGVDAMIERFRNASPEERRTLMEEAQKLSEEDRAKLREAMRGAMGGRGGGRGRGGGGGGGGPRAQAGVALSGDEAKWLKFDEDRVSAGEESQFLDWTPFEHPQLGVVEIGGFRPGFKHNPSAEETERLAAEQAAFVASLAGELPRVAMQEPEVEALGPGIYRIAVRVANDGAMPSMSAIGVKARRALPTILAIELPLERLVAGERIVRHWGIPAHGGIEDTEWIVTGQPGSEIKIAFAPTVGPKRTVTIKLPEAAR